MGERAATRGLSYQVKSRAVPGGEFRPFACSACHVCELGHEIRLTGKNNPEIVEQKFRAAGWTFDAWNARRVICPDCIAKRTAARHGESGRKEGEKVVTLTLPAKPAAAAVPQGGALPPNRTELTVEERARIRTVLGGTFDEAAGQYSDGWSDMRVAQEAGGLPPKLVADFREVAFGPLRSVIEIEPIKADLAALEKRMAEEIATLRRRLDEAQRQLGVRP